MTEARKHFVGRAVMVLTIAEARVADITAFGGPELLPRFGLPRQLER
jgi:hypothetical protein